MINGLLEPYQFQINGAITCKIFFFYNFHLILYFLILSRGGTGLNVKEGTEIIGLCFKFKIERTYGIILFWGSIIKLNFSCSLLFDYEVAINYQFLS